jgi:Flp pilus assembly protein TadG
MLRPLIDRSRRSFSRRTGERGVTMALVAVSMVAMISMAALSIDIGTLYEASAEAQRAADAAALAAARTIAMSGITGDTNGLTDGSWASICGGKNPISTLIAIQVAQQNLISGVAVPTGSVTVNYGAGSGASGPDCTAAGATFAVNPVVTVAIQSAKLPIFFARVFSLLPSGNYSGTKVSAKASAEVFNPSSSGAGATVDVTPVQPRCVKPLMIPNIDPVNPSTTCTAGTCKTFVTITSGAITTAGIAASGSGVIGERFKLQPDCDSTKPGCALVDAQPGANNGLITPNLEFVPGQVPTSSSAFTALPSCASGGKDFTKAIAGCDQTTAYQCGVTAANTVDLTQANFRYTDTPIGTECLIHQTVSATVLSGQDTLDPFLTNATAPPTYPFQIQAGTANPILQAGVASTSPITSSTSIITIPIYDNTAATIGPATTAVTIVGFLQVFVYGVDPTTMNMDVAVMNVSGCGNGATKAPLYGTSPVPVRLITTPAGD